MPNPLLKKIPSLLQSEPTARLENTALLPRTIAQVINLLRDGIDNATHADLQRMIELGILARDMLIEKIADTDANVDANVSTQMEQWLVAADDPNDELSNDLSIPVALTLSFEDERIPLTLSPDTPDSQIVFIAKHSNARAQRVAITVTTILKEDEIC